MKWIIIIAVVLWWLHQRGKKELARKEAEKRAKEQPAEPQIDIVAPAERSERAAVTVRELRVRVEAALHQVDPYAIENSEDHDTDDEMPEGDDGVAAAKTEPYDVAEVPAAIERTSEVASAHVPRPAHGLNAASTKSRVLVRDSVIMQTLLQRHPGNYIYWRRR